MSYKRSSIEELMARKLGKIYQRFAFTTDRNKILMKELKKVLTAEVNDLLKRRSMISPPFDPFKITKIGRANITVVYEPRKLIGADGSIVTVDDGFLIKIDRDLGERSRLSHRLRSTMAHELMHTFFYDVDQLPPVKIGHNAQSRKQFLMREELCHYLARNLLIPTFSIFNFTGRKRFMQPSLANVERLKSIFITSSDVVAYRMIIDLDLWNAIFTKFQKNGSVYKPKTQLKDKSNELYQEISIPTKVPADRSRVQQRLLSDHIEETAKRGRLKKEVRIGEKRLALESRVETVDPVSIITLAYEISEG